jgi:acyl-CoA synthetase (AMP-forming)/AMP-acid ligase II
MNVTEPIRRAAHANPAGVAVVRADHSTVPYQPFDRMIDAMARHLATLGLVAGQTVGLAIEGPDEFAGMLLALALARLGVASADPALPSARMDLCIVEARRPAAPNVATVTVDSLLAGMQQSPEDATPLPIHPDASLMFRIFASSGTTGTPNFSAVSHALMAGRVADSSHAIGRAPSVQLCAIGLGITWGCTRMLRTFWTGGTLAISNPTQALACIRRHKVSAVSITPISLQQVLAAMPADAPRPSSLQLIEVGGSVLSPRLAAMTRQRLCETLFSHFGSTETGGVASGRFSMFADTQEGVGYLRPGVEVEALGDEGSPLPPGSEGALRIRGPHAVTGYVGDDVASATAFRDGWFHSGDLGSVSPDGLLSITGREGDFINAGGIKLSPKIVEDVLRSLPDISDAAAFGVPDRMGVQQIWAAFVAPVPVDPSVVHAACRTRLAEKAPKFLIQVNRIPRNANGKLVRPELARFAADQQP